MSETETKDKVQSVSTGPVSAERQHIAVISLTRRYNSNNFRRHPAGYNIYEWPVFFLEASASDPDALDPLTAVNVEIPRDMWREDRTERFGVILFVGNDIYVTAMQKPIPAKGDVKGGDAFKIGFPFGAFAKLT